MAEIPGFVPIEEGTERERMLREAAERFGVADVERFERIERERLERGQMAPERDILTSTTHPEGVRWAFRSFAKNMEMATTEAPLYGDRYAQLGMYWLAKSRATALELGRPEKKSLLEFLHLEEDGIAVHHMVPPLEIAEVEEYEITPDMPKKESEYRERKNREICRKNEEIRRKQAENKIKREQAETRREALITELHRVAEEFAARAKLDLQFQRYESTGGAIDEYAKNFLVPTSAHLLAIDFERIFTAPPTLYQEPGRELPEELQSSPDKEHLGDSINRAILAYDVISLCEKPEELEKLKKRPGWKWLFPSEEEEKKWIGDSASWKREKRTKDDLNGENRGPLTQKGNILAHKESTKDTLGVRKAVVDFIGGDEVAERLAFRMYCLSASAAAGGSEYYWEADKKGYEIELEGFPISDDLTKLTCTADWQWKQTANGHPCGPLHTKFKYKRLLVDFFSFAAYETDYPVIKGETGKRSLRELMWGYPAEQGRLEEPAKRLSEIEWRKLPREIWRDFMLRVFLAGREDGLLERLTKDVWTPQELTKKTFWEQMNTNCTVVVGAPLVTGGRYRGRKSEEIESQVAEHKKEVKGLFWKGVEEGRENKWWLVERDKIEGGKSTRDIIKAVQVDAGYRK